MDVPEPTLTIYLLGTILKDLLCSCNGLFTRIFFVIRGFYTTYYCVFELALALTIRLFLKGVIHVESRPRNRQHSLYPRGTG